MLLAFSWDHTEIPWRSHWDSIGIQILTGPQRGIGPTWDPNESPTDGSMQACGQSGERPMQKGWIEPALPTKHGNFDAAQQRNQAGGG